MINRLRSATTFISYCPSALPGSTTPRRVELAKTYLSKVTTSNQEVNPLFSFLDVLVVKIDPDETVLRLPFRREFIQGGGVVAGGVLATLADEAMAHLVLANLAEGWKTATIEMNMRYLRPVFSGELRAVATLTHRGGSVLSTQAQLFDSKERLAAVAGASFFVIAPKG